MLSKVFVNIKTVLQNHCTQCLYWLNFFFWAHFRNYNENKLRNKEKKADKDQIMRNTAWVHVYLHCSRTKRPDQSVHLLCNCPLDYLHCGKYEDTRLIYLVMIVAMN